VISLGGNDGRAGSDASADGLELVQRGPGDCLNGNWREPRTRSFPPRMNGEHRAVRLAHDLVRYTAHYQAADGDGK